MKRLFLFLAIGTAIMMLTASFIMPETPPKLYPELENYFKSDGIKEFKAEHVNALANLRNDISLSHSLYDDWNLIFYCSENTFRSQASQVFAQTLCYARNHRKVKVFSAGLTSGEIHPKLIAYLTKMGYKMTKIEKDGKAAYEVRFADRADPIILFSKTTGDKSLPATDVTSVIVCDVKAETDCAALKTESMHPLHLAFTKLTTGASDEEAETTLKEIAAEIVYITKK